MSDDDPRVIGSDDKLIQNCNWQIVNCSTPANYFHVLRRQVHREFRKPLVVMSPKNLLRHKECKSDIAEMGQDSKFKRTISERHPDFVDTDDKINKVIFCSGAVYYALKAEREKLGRTDVALVTLEQISPFPFTQVMQDLNKYSNAQVVWCQEEPLNMGSWAYVEPRFRTALVKGLEDKREPLFVGRAPSAAPGTGHMSQHTKEITQFLEEAFA